MQFFSKNNVDQTSTFSEREKASKEVGYLLLLSWQGVSFYPKPTHMFSAFWHQRHHKDLVWDNKGSKQGTSNVIQPTRGSIGAQVNEKNEWM